MSLSRKQACWFLLFGVGIGPVGLVGMSVADEEASVLVQSEDAAATETPQLIAPRNEQPLPPPRKPSIASAPREVEVERPKQPFLRPTEPKRVAATTALSIAEEPMPAPEVPQPRREYLEASPISDIEVRPAPPIKYDTDRDARRLYRRSGEINVVMIAKNPADGCYYEIPMCIPACCVGEPTVSGGRGLLGRGIVEFCWPDCGFRAIVKFRHIRGDVRVDYEGE